MVIWEGSTIFHCSIDIFTSYLFLLQFFYTYVVNINFKINYEL